jgi:UDP-glucose 4-epimerase
VKNVFITGGAGYIGSHCTASLIEKNYRPIIIDNFSNSTQSVIKNLEFISNKKITFYNVDIRNKSKLKSIFKKHKCYSVIHCAGLKAVNESLKKPISYFDNNIGATLSLLECMEQYKIYNLIFSSSATVYNETQSTPLKETDTVGKTKNPYGTSKYLIERILMDITKSDKKWSVRIARYFNPISNHPSGLINENSKGIPSNLIPYIIKVAKKKLPYLNVFGRDYKSEDGTCIRDYIHVMDLAEGHVAMLKDISKKKGLKTYNFGTGKGTSVLKIIRAFEKQTGVTIPFKFTKRRKGDVAISVCSPQKAKKDLYWKSKISIQQAMKDLKKII